MTNKNQHVLFVDQWIDSLPSNPPALSVKELFQAAFDAVWRRAQVTLGEITMVAVCDRIVHLAVEIFPWLYSVQVDAKGISLNELSDSENQVREGLQFLLCEFLSVLHDLTGGVITANLRAVILKIPENRLPANSLLDHRKQT